MYGNESRPAIENKYESSDLKAYESYCRSAGLDRDNTLGLRTEEQDVEEAFSKGVLDNIHLSLEATTLGETSLLNSMAFTQEEIKAVERESLGSETEFIEDDDNSKFWSRVSEPLETSDNTTDKNREVESEQHGKLESQSDQSLPRSVSTESTSMPNGKSDLIEKFPGGPNNPG